MLLTTQAKLQNDQPKKESLFIKTDDPLMVNGREGSIDQAVCEQAIIGAAGAKYFTQNCQSRAGS